MKCKIVTWDEVQIMCRCLVAKIERSKYKPETIIALARSGFVPGRILSDLLGATDLVGLKVEHWLDYTGKHKDKAIIPYKIPFNVKGRKVLVVDDIVDTGKSMALSVEYIKQFKPAQLKVAVMQYLTTSQFIPDYYAVRKAGWTWFIYPWNLTEDLCNLTVRLLKAEPELCSNLDKLPQRFKEKYDLEVESTRIGEIIATLKKRGRMIREKGIWVFR